MAHSVGVTYEPEISEFDLDPRSDVMLVLASDGVWDVMSAEDIRKVWPPPSPCLHLITFTLFEILNPLPRGKNGVPAAWKTFPVALPERHLSTT